MLPSSANIFRREILILKTRFVAAAAAMKKENFRGRPSCCSSTTSILLSRWESCHFSTFIREIYQLYKSPLLSLMRLKDDRINHGSKTLSTDVFKNGGFLYRNLKVSNKNGCSLRTFATLQIIKDSPIYFFRAKKKKLLQWVLRHCVIPLYTLCILSSLCFNVQNCCLSLSLKKTLNFKSWNFSKPFWPGPWPPHASEKTCSRLAKKISRAKNRLKTTW